MAKVHQWERDLIWVHGGLNKSWNKVAPLFQQQQLILRRSNKVWLSQDGQRWVGCDWLGFAFSVLCESKMAAPNGGVTTFLGTDWSWVFVHLFGKHLASIFVDIGNVNDWFKAAREKRGLSIMSGSQFCNISLIHKWLLFLFSWWVRYQCCTVGIELTQLFLDQSF